jgi:phosphatidate cytidylyltransferase
MSDGLHTLALTAGLFLVGPLLIIVVRLVGGRRPGQSEAVRRVPLWLRYATLVVLTALFLGAAWTGEVAFALLVSALALIGARELVRLFLGAAALPGRRDRLAARAGAAALTILFVGLLFAFVLLLRRGTGGFGRVVFLYATMQLNDIFSMLGGLAFGKRKLAPTLSPGKTWVGMGSGLIATASGAQLFHYCLPHLTAWQISALAAGLAICGVAGGLIASALKRSVGAKDFGTLLPGHGGVLDRFDSLLVAAPFLWLVLALFGP